MKLASVEEAFAIRAGRRVDLVLLGSDIVEEKGIGVFKLIEEKIPGAKTLLVTDSSSHEFVQTCLKSGADGVLLKPFTVESARQRVDSILGRRTSSSMIPLTELTGATRDCAEKPQ
jgi:DNA-binding NarL/FixJ family response regulator